MEHRSVSVHPFSLSHRVDYCLNWRPPPAFSLPYPFFHFSFVDIYWNLSEKFPSSHPFPKVELQRGEKKLVACVCMWFINDPKHTFIFSFLLPFSVSYSLLVCLLVSFKFFSFCSWPLTVFFSPHTPHRCLFSFPGQLYHLLNQYFDDVCKNCRTSHPHVSLYDFIYDKVSSFTLNSRMSPVMADPH